MFARLVILCLDTAIGGEHMAPVGIQYVELVIVGFVRREACRVPRNVGCGSYAFRLIQRDLRRCQLGLAVRASRRFFLAVSRLVSFALLQSLEIAPLRVKEKSR